MELTAKIIGIAFMLLGGVTLFVSTAYYCIDLVITKCVNLYKGTKTLVEFIYYKSDFELYLKTKDVGNEPKKST